MALLRHKDAPQDGELKTAIQKLADENKFPLKQVRESALIEP